MSQSPDAAPPQSANQPIRFERDPATGLVKGLTYRYTAEGLIDWRALVPVKYLYVAREHEDKVMAAQGKLLPEVDLLSVKDDWLRIRVGGLNHILHLRGARSVRYPHMQTREGFCGVSCEIELIPNVESGMQPEVWSGIASACRTSMDAKMLPYLETFAENRAFSRAIKRALQINILSDIETPSRNAAGGDDETKETDLANAPAPSSFHPYDELRKLCLGHKDAKTGATAPITFEMLKAAAIKLNADAPPEGPRVLADPAQWKGFEDIQPIDVWLLHGKILERDAAAKVVKKGKTS